MKIHPSIGLSLFLFSGGLAVARADDASGNINPALTYYQAFSAAPTYSPEDRDYLATNEWRGQKLPERFGNLLGGYDSEFRLLRQAAQATVPCDWGIDWSAGPDTLLPHLARIKAAANTARLRAMWDLQHDRQADAREDLHVALALGRNGTTDGSLISALVQIAVERIVCSTIAENFSQFTPETLQQLADGFNATPVRGSIAACIPLEKSFFEQWLLQRVAVEKAAGGDDAKVMEAIRQTWIHETTSGDASQPTNSTWPQVFAASGGTSDGFVNLLRSVEPLYDRVATLEALPYAQYQEQMPAMTAEIDRSTNPFVREFFPAIEKCRPKEFAALADIAMVQAAVQYKLHGEPGRLSVTDPCGQGPFGLQRFMFDGVDRGFELTAACSGLAYPEEVLIFVETDGPPFLVFGKNAGKAPTPN